MNNFMQSLEFIFSFISILSRATQRFFDFIMFLKKKIKNTSILYALDQKSSIDVKRYCKTAMI